MLMKKVDQYLALRRAAGYELKTPEYLLRGFARFAAGRKEVLIRTTTVIEWASQAPSLNQREYRLQVVIRLARHLQVEDPRNEVPPRGVFRRQKTRPTPYILTRKETDRLLATTSQLGPPDSLRPLTYSTLFALLVVTGLRISEALALQFDDFVGESLLIRKTKFKKSRRIPLHETTVAALHHYLNHRKRVVTDHSYIFISLGGNRLTNSLVGKAFRRVRKTAGLDP